MFIKEKPTLNKAINILIKRIFSMTTLMWACKSKYSNKECIKMLLHHKDIKVNQRDKSGRTAFILASNRGDLEIIQMLLEHKNVDVNQNTTKVLCLFKFDVSIRH
jgi:ankyrin repeat protein